MCALYLSYATLVTYVPVLGAEQVQFPCRVIFYGFLAGDEKNGSNWFLLILQKAKPSTKKEDCCLVLQDFTATYLLSL